MASGKRARNSQASSDPGSMSLAGSVWSPLQSQLLFSIEEVAAILSLSKREIENLIRAGILESGIAPGTKRARRVSRRHLERYVDRLESGC